MVQVHVSRNKEHLIEILNKQIAKLGKEYSYKIIKRIY